MIKCEWYKGGYCEYYGDAEEQEQRDTNWPCDGTEDEMQECGQIENISIYQGTGLGCGDSRAIKADEWCGR